MKHNICLLCQFIRVSRISDRLACCDRTEILCGWILRGDLPTISLQFIKGAPPALSFAEIRVQCVSLSGLSNLVLRYDVWRQSDGHFSDEFSPFHLFIRRRRRAARRRRVAVRKSCFLSHERQRQFENNEFRCGGAARCMPPLPRAL